MPRQDRHQAEDQRQFAVVGAGEIETHAAFAERFGAFHLDVVRAVKRPTVIAQQAPRKDHVVRSDRRAVGKACGRIDLETHPAARRVGFHRARQQRIERERFVVTAREQALIDIAAQIDRRQSLHDEGIETVECSQHALGEAPALGRLRVGISRVRKARPPGRVAMHGDGMRGGGAARRERAECTAGERADHDRAPGRRKSCRGETAGREQERGLNAIRLRFCANLSQPPAPPHGEALGSAGATFRRHSSINLGFIAVANSAIRQRRDVTQLPHFASKEPA